MNIAVASCGGQVCENLGDCREFLLVTAEEQTPTGKRLLPCAAGTTEIIKMLSLEKVDVLICGAIGLAARNALEMVGVLLIPGCSGAAEETVAKFLVGEAQGDPTILTVGREDDPDDPMACMHDCANCAGCGPIEILKQIPPDDAE